MPKITVLLPVFNSELYIYEAVESILNQTFTDFELFIFDDGSTDNTSKIIQSFNDTRIIYKKNGTNVGYLTHLNEGLRIAKGKYIARMDADDIALPDRFEVQYNYLEKNPDVGICGSWCEYFGNLSGIDKRPERFEDVLYHMFFGCPLTHPTIMMRVESIHKHNLQYNPEFYYAEDHDFFATASAFFKIVNIPQVLLKYRIHPNQIGSAKWKEQYQVKCKIQAKIFSKTLLNCSQDDFNWLTKFFTEKSIPHFLWFKETDLYKSRIINDNEIRSLYPTDILEKACNEIFEAKLNKNIYNYFILKYYNRKEYSLHLFKSFLYDELPFRKYVEFKLIWKLLIKCMIGYTK